MRVDAYNKVAQLYQTNATSKVTKQTSVSAKDKVEISRLGREYQVAKQAIQNTSDIRKDKVDEIKHRMESGTYDITSKEVANKLVDSIFNQII